MPIQPEVPTKALPAQLASTILEEKHMVSIIMYLAENDGCMKTDVYTDVARNSRMPEKLGMLEDAGIIVMNRMSGAVQIHITKTGREVVDQLRNIEGLIVSAMQEGCGE